MLVQWVRIGCGPIELNAGWMIAITGLTKPVATMNESQIESPLSASFDLCP